jgi:predicted esterase
VAARLRPCGAGKTVDDPHADPRILRRGPAPSEARLVAILAHGRGGSADDILTIADVLDAPDVAYLAPQAAGRTWYPQSFLAPIDLNEPFLTSALGVIARSIDDLQSHGIPSERVVLIGFSQGGCLSLEFAARHARRYAAVVGLSAGLIGPPGTPRTYAGSLAGTPVFLGCSDVDAHIPLERVHETAVVLRQLGGDVDERIYPGAGHNINEDEVEAVKAMISGSRT